VHSKPEKGIRTDGMTSGGGVESVGGTFLGLSDWEVEEIFRDPRLGRVATVHGEIRKKLENQGIKHDLDV